VFKPLHTVCNTPWNPVSLLRCVPVSVREKSRLHHLTDGFNLLGIVCGYGLGISSDPLWRRNYARLVRQWEAQGGEPGGSEPEFRLPPTIYGAFLVPIGLFGRLVVAS